MTTDPFWLSRRPRNTPDCYWYFCPKHSPNRWRTTKTKEYEAAREYALDHLNEGTKRSTQTLKQYTKDFFIPGRCAWSDRMLAKGREFANGYFEQHRSRLENYIWPTLGHFLIVAVTRKMIDEALIGMKNKHTGEPLSHETKWKILTGIRKIFEQIQYEEIRADNPAEDIEPFHGESERREVFSVEELQQLFPRDRQELLRIWGSRMWATYFFVSACCGLRPGETSAIHWQDWHRSLDGIIIKRAVKTKSNTIRGIKTDKTGVRKIPKPIPDRLTQELLIYEQNRDSDLMFSLDGKVIGSPTARKHFRESLKRAGLKNTDRPPYSLRHTYETHLLEVMFDREVQVLMGHRNEITKRYDQRSDEAYLSFSQQFKEKIEQMRPL
jgi:integrase